jgi:hypothetical protein
MVHPPSGAVSCKNRVEESWIQDLMDMCANSIKKKVCLSLLIMKEIGAIAIILIVSNVSTLADYNLTDLFSRHIFAQIRAPGCMTPLSPGIPGFYPGT